MTQNGTTSARLSAKQRAAIPFLLTCRSLDEASRSAGISRATLYRWLKTSEFNGALADAQGDAIDAAVRNIQASSGDAVACLRDVMSSKTAAPAIRVLAARGLIELAVRLRPEGSSKSRIARVGWVEDPDLPPWPQLERENL